MLKLRLIDAADTYELRQKILRPQQSIDDCKYKNDAFDDTFHVGAFSGGTLVSIASFYQETNPHFEEMNQFRLRGMATMEQFRNQNAGRSLLKFAEKELNRCDADLWWCNARTTVSRYYEKMGLEAIGEVFEIDPIGPHRLMYKKLT